MNRRPLTFLTALASAFVLVLAARSSAPAQARPGGGAAGAGRSQRVESAMGRSIDVSMGRSNGGTNMGGPELPNLPNREPYEYAERARLRDINERNADKDLRNHPDMPARLNTTADELRKGYREAVFHNPLLTFGQYVAVTRLAANLGPTHPKVTRVALLNGLTARKSIERTLRDLGLGKDEAKEARRRAEREIKESSRRA